jgi:hypothetical protein
MDNEEIAELFEFGMAGKPGHGTNLLGVDKYGPNGQHATSAPGTRFFDENLLHPKATAIDAPKFIEFDWELLRRSLGEAKEELGEVQYAVLADIMGELLRWIVKGDKLHIIGRRAVALAWVVNPDIFKGISAASLARRVGCHRAMLSEDATDASRKYGVRNRAQQHGWNFKKDQRAKKTATKRKRKKGN